MSRPKIGFLGLTLELYAQRFPDLVVGLGGFAATLCERLSRTMDVVAAPVAFTRDAVDRAVARFEGEGADAIVVVLLSYSPSLISLPALLRTRLPIIVFNTQKLAAIDESFSAAEMTDNHGMHGVQDLCNVLARHGRAFELVTGHYEDLTATRAVEERVLGAAAAGALRGKRVGILGHTFDGMGDLYVDGTLLLARTGVEVCHLSSARLAERIAEATSAEVEELVAADRAAFEVDASVTDDDLRIAARTELGLRALIEEERLSAVCPLFTAATDHPGIPMLPFLAVSKLLAEGLGYGGEGDPTSAVATLLMQQLTRETNFTEMFTIDFAGNSIFMNHMAETNYRLGRDDMRPRLYRNDATFLSGAPPVCVFAAQRPGRVTLANLAATAGGGLKLIVFGGEAQDRGPVPGILSPHFRLSPHYPGGVSEFLTRYSLEGGSHHLALGYGDHRDALRSAARAMGIEHVELGER